MSNLLNVKLSKPISGNYTRLVTLFYLIWNFAFPELTSFSEPKYASIHEKIFYIGFDFFNRS